MLYSVSTLHCMTQSLARGGEGLGACWGPEKAEDYARRAGTAWIKQTDGHSRGVADCIYAVS